MALHVGSCGFQVFGFKAGAAPMDSEQFLNQKAEAYFRLREYYKAGLISHRTSEQIDDDCEAQLCAVEYRELPRGQIQVEPKEDARKRGVQSPDRAEAEVMAFLRVVPREQTVVFGGNYQISPI